MHEKELSPGEFEGTKFCGEKSWQSLLSHAAPDDPNPMLSPMCFLKWFSIPLAIFALGGGVAGVVLADPPAAAASAAPAAAGQLLEETVQTAIKSVIGREAAAAVQEKVQDAVSGTLQKASVEVMKDVTLVLRVSKEFIRQHTPPPVEKVSSVDRCLFGARVAGTATTTGQPTVSLSADHTKPGFTLHFAGTTVTHTVATKGPVKGFNTGRAVFDVHREICFNGTQFSDGPEMIECSYDSTLTGLSVPPGLRGRIVRNRALPEIARHRPAADAIALADTRTEVLKSFGERTDKLVADLNANVPWKQTLALLAPQDSDWVGSFSATKEWIEARSSHLHGPVSDLPEEAARLQAPIELWVLGKPDGAMSGKLLALWSVRNGALDRFRTVTSSPAAAVAAGIEPAVVGEWWVIRVGADLAERFVDGLPK